MSRTDSNGAKAEYGPAVIFGGKPPADPNLPIPPSGVLKVTTTGTSTVTTTATANNVGPGPFVADKVFGKCTATSSTHTWTATITNGKVISTDANGNTSRVVNVPLNPAANFTIPYQLEHLGDAGKVVFNERKSNADGTFTENAVHMYLQGPTAVGDLVIGQATCGG